MIILPVKPNKRQIEKWKVKLMKERAKRLMEYYADHKPLWDWVDANKPKRIDESLVREQQKLFRDVAFV